MNIKPSQVHHPGKALAMWALLFPLALAQSLYTVFVIQELWNWFVAEALHATTISYGQALGVFMLVKLLTHQDDVDELLNERWEQVLPLIELCVPEENRVTFAKAVKATEPEGIPLKLLRIFGGTIGEAIKATLALGIGWLAKLFLM